MTRSAHCRRYYLRRISSHSADHRLAISRTEAFLDAIAAGDLSTARSIADLSPNEWLRDGEYEDDFCYYSFLHSLILHPDRDDGRERTLLRFESALEDGDSQRLRVCWAMMERSRDAFVECFEALLRDIRDKNDKKRQTIEDYELTYWPRCFISVEGYALLRMAEILGMGVEGEEFVLCPHLGWLPMGTEATKDLFDEIDHHLGKPGV